MNNDTLVAVSCYAGDKYRVENGLELYLHHQRPVVLLSPADAPVALDHPFIASRSAGIRGVEGPDHLARWDEYFRMLLAFPYNFFFICDSDAFCLSPKLPDRFYENPDVFWSYHHPDHRPRPESYPYPRLAYQSPMFLSRASLEKMMRVDRAKVPCNSLTPYQDWYLVALAHEAGIKCAHNFDGVSYMGWNGDDKHTVVDTFAMGPEWRGEDMMVADVMKGVIFIHSVRHPRVIQRLVQARQDYLCENRG